MILQQTSQHNLEVRTAHLIDSYHHPKRASETFVLQEKKHYRIWSSHLRFLSHTEQDVLVSLARRDPCCAIKLFFMIRDEGQLYRTALVDRRLSILIRPILPRSIYFILDYERESGLERCQQYLRSCSERPELGQETRNVTIVWHKRPQRMLGCENDANLAVLLDSLVTKWSNIRWLRIYCPQRSGRVSLPSLYQNPFPELRHLHLTLPPLSITQVLRFRRLPKLRSIEVDRISDSHLATDSEHQHQITTCVENFIPLASHYIL